MNFIEASVLILFMAILCVPVANRFKIPLEIFLFIGSCFISLIPGLPTVTLDPMVVFDLFLPPILFAAAYFTSWKDFKFNLRPITLLAFGLVIFTSLIVAVVAKLILPSFSWAEAFLLGAIIAPTDASAATAIIKRLGAPKRIITILEGESLINDATALIIYRFSIAAIVYGSFSLPDAILEFSLITTGGLFVGFAISTVAVNIYRLIDDRRAETAFTFITAFASYLIAERLGFSGVIATVVSGIWAGFYFPEFAATQTKVNAKAAWGVLLFIINGFVFTLIGFQLPMVIKNLGDYQLKDLIYYGSVISAVVILVRICWIYPAAYIPRLLFPAIARRDPVASWKYLFTLGWTGMRGIVSLAAVLAIPSLTAKHLPFSHVELLIFVTYFVMMATLIIPTFTLPFLVQKFNLSDSNDNTKQEALARLCAVDAVIKRINYFANENQIPMQVVNEFLENLLKRKEVIQTQLSDNPYSVLSNNYFAYKKLVYEAIKIEREKIIVMRRHGEIDEEIFRNLSEELDLEEIRMNSMRI
ncbi:MAG: Na+/H+ antiporter [Proteobacteria bacterium]|nr:Na+/H+ antiporter [Pseudomonadota bacterium]